MLQTRAVHVSKLEIPTLTGLIIVPIPCYPRTVRRILRAENQMDDTLAIASEFCRVCVNVFLPFGPPPRREIRPGGHGDITT